MAKKIGRPTVNPADIQLRIRLNKDDAYKLQKASEALNINKSDVVRQGINIIYQGLQKD